MISAKPPTVSEVVTMSAASVGNRQPASLKKPTVAGKSNALIRPACSTAPPMPRRRTSRPTAAARSVITERSSLRPVIVIADNIAATSQEAKVLQRIASSAIAAPRRILAVAALIMVVCGVFGIPVAGKLSAGGFQDPTSESALVSRDGKTGLIVAGITGGETGAQRHAEELSKALLYDRDGVTVRAGGVAMTYVQINAQTERDLLLMESIAIPLSFVVLVWVFGGLLAAGLPLAVGGLAILGSMAVLRAVTLITDVSIFALNLSIAMGLALAIDYTLLIISRYRDELADGADRERALIRTMTTAGRTVLFSAMTVALSMVAMVMFPMYFLKSFAYAGIAVVAFAAVAAIVTLMAAV